MLNRRAATQNFLPRHYHILDAAGAHHGVNEAASTVFLLKSGRLPKHGLRFNGVLFAHEETREIPAARENGLARFAVSGTKSLPPGAGDEHWRWSGGIYLVRTSRALVVATFCTERGHSGDVCRAAVDGLARFMTDFAC